MSTLSTSTPTSARTLKPVNLGLQLALALAVLALAFAPLWAGRAELRLLMEVLSYLALAQMWNLLAGYSGLISVGQQAYVGLGGYLFFALAMFAGIPVLAALPLAAVVTALIAIPSVWVAFRLQGAYFAIGTWVIAASGKVLPTTRRRRSHPRNPLHARGNVLSRADAA